jgi:tetratricopeptide (TPR) repeat protein
MARSATARRPGVRTGRPLCCLLLAAGFATLAVADASANDTITLRDDPRPVIAVIGFTTPGDGDPRDAWLATAFQEFLARRLRRTPGVVAIPTLRLVQSRNELTGPQQAPPEWRDVLPRVGARYWLTGKCDGPAHAVTLETTLHDLRGEHPPQTVTLPADRYFATLDAATRWAHDTLKIPALDEKRQALVFAQPSKSPSAVEYYARALDALRDDDRQQALRYAAHALSSDRRLRPALQLLAGLEAGLAAPGYGSATRRLRVLSDLSRLAHDPYDRAHAELAQGVLLQLDGAFDAACTRMESALAIAYANDDVYGQLAAISSLADLYLLRPAAMDESIPEAARIQFARQSVEHAAEWERLLLDALTARGDLVSSLPAANKLALLYERLEQPDDALRAHQQTLDLARQLDSRHHQAAAWLYLGRWYRSQDDQQQAVDALNRCLALSNEQARPMVRLLLSNVYADMAQPTEALSQLELAYDEVRNTDDLTTQFTCLRELADARMNAGQRQRAITALRAAIDIAHVLQLQSEADLRVQLDEWEQEARRDG